MTEDTLFDSQNAAYVQAMFEDYARNPEAVPEEWRELFRDGRYQATAESLTVTGRVGGSPAAAPVAA